jgi:ubiquinone/menaquinone biosynthesis C-methylase UbiE
VDIVGPAGRLVGLDASEAMIAEARRRASEHQVPLTLRSGMCRRFRSQTPRSTCAAPHGC